MADAHAWSSPHLQSTSGFAYSLFDMTNRKPQAVNAPHRTAPTPFILCADDTASARRQFRDPRSDRPGPAVGHQLHDDVAVLAGSCFLVEALRGSGRCRPSPDIDRSPAAGPMPRTAPGGRFPPLPVLMWRSFTGRLNWMRSIRN